MLNRRDVFLFTIVSSISLSIVYYSVVLSGWPVIEPVVCMISLSALCGFLCLFAVPESARLLVAAGLAGRDCHKPASDPPTKLAEATGVTVGFTYAIALTFLIPFLFIHRELTQEHLTELGMFLSALLSVNSMCFLGFADNVLNLRWRHKLTLPTIAAMPVLLVYYIAGGSTYVLIPDFLRFYVQKIYPSHSLAVDFGVWYYVFLGMLSVFGTNAINILAGLNGLEIGQSLVLTGAMIGNVLVQMNRHSWTHWEFNDETVFTLHVLVPFFVCSVALWIFNKYPSRVFVGDTYCYLAGTVLAVAGILGHCSKTLLLFMVPQVVNFLYSLPQLAKVIPCPRHRMPTYVEKSDTVDVSFTDWVEEGSVNRMVLWVMEVSGACKIERRKKGGLIRFSNLTVINWFLWKVGKPMNEGRLVKVLLAIQLVWIGIAFMLRYKAASYVYTLVD